MSEDAPSLGIQNFINQIVASNLTGVMFSRMETLIANEPDKDYANEEVYAELVATVTTEVMGMYGCIWEALEKGLQHIGEQGTGEDTQTDTSVSG
jgi:hypothetical protein